MAGQVSSLLRTRGKLAPVFNSRHLGPTWAWADRLAGQFDEIRGHRVLSPPCIGRRNLPRPTELDRHAALHVSPRDRPEPEASTSFQNQQLGRHANQLPWGDPCGDTEGINVRCRWRQGGRC